jgi:hypothetical protein
MNLDLHPEDIGRRPENRRRAAETLSAPWAELPRSEAFFEDLDLAPLPLLVPSPPPRHRLSA